jgi:dTDP-4-amino-4,6-dideoxygalactose transaminase
MTSKQPACTPFNRPAITGFEQAYLAQAIESGQLAAGGPFSKRCNSWLRDHFATARSLTTTSCTHALEMAALLCNLQPGDEVILPSFAFSSAATAFARCGATLIFVDIEPATMNIDPLAVAAAVTPRSRVIVALHYGGVACDMNALAETAAQHDLLIVEDAAHAIFSTYHQLPCGTLGAYGCLSFHESKNIHCGEGGALLVNRAGDVSRAEIIWDKGTDRLRFLRGEIDRYTWQEIGSSYALGDLCAAFLLAQLECGRVITDDRLRSWHAYLQALSPLAEHGLVELPVIPDACHHNGHIFWIKTRDQEQQSSLIAFLKQRSIHCAFHYSPLHSSLAGRRHGRFAGEDRYTSQESSRLVRLPLYYGFRETERVVEAIHAFYGLAPGSC